MQIQDHLSSFSIEDLRILAARRGVRLPVDRAVSRQSFVSVLAATIGRDESVIQSLHWLSVPELLALSRLPPPPKKTGVSSFARQEKIPVEIARMLFERLRMDGLLFPQGDWEEVAVPPAVHRVVAYYVPRHLASSSLADVGMPPDPVTAPPDSCQPRPSSPAHDVAELFAFVARNRIQLTQAERLNRRDLKTISQSLAIQDTDYAQFLSELALGLSWLSEDRGGRLVVTSEGEEWLKLDQVERGRMLLAIWSESPSGMDEAQPTRRWNPYSAPGAFKRRATLIRVFKDRAANKISPMTLTSLTEWVRWAAPVLATREALADAAQLQLTLRSMYWLGLLTVSKPARPVAAALAPIGELLTRRTEEEAPPVPEESSFVLQPNSEVFAPPNIHPAVLYHLRRITGEKKVRQIGVHPLTPDSIRRALDSQLNVEEICAFLEGFSQTGLPANVRTMIESVGRQHGRVRLIPAGYVLMTDSPELMEELHRMRGVNDFLGARLADKVAIVPQEVVPEVMKRLRKHGYAPIDAGETTTNSEMPRGKGDLTPQELASPLALDIADEIDEEPALVDKKEIRALLTRCSRSGGVVELGYIDPHGSTDTVTLDVQVLVGDMLLGTDVDDESERVLSFQGILWARPLM
jgi:hypothetical protein